MKTLKKTVAVVLLSGALVAGGAGVAQAQTVYYKGVAISWDHGRTAAFWSESTVQSGRFDHRTTANTTTTKWEPKGTAAHATQWVGTAPATAYWDARG